MAPWPVLGKWQLLDSQGCWEEEEEAKVKEEEDPSSSKYNQYFDIAMPTFGKVDPNTNLSNPL